MTEFTPWPKIARLNRDIVITEKIDGTNAAVGIVEYAGAACVDTQGPCAYLFDGEKTRLVYAQSRKSIITPEKDNFGFAKWVHDNAEALAATLGPGLHFGEWWGSGIQRGYGLPKGERRFSLFNTSRWGTLLEDGQLLPKEIPGLGVVPVLYEGPFDVGEKFIRSPWTRALEDLRFYGSAASPGFMNPEGIVLYHKAANEMFKVTLEGDEEPKSLKAAA